MSVCVAISGALATIFSLEKSRKWIIRDGFTGISRERLRGADRHRREEVPGISHGGEIYMGARSRGPDALHPRFAAGTAARLRARWRSPTTAAAPRTGCFPRTATASPRRTALRPRTSASSEALSIARAAAEAAAESEQRALLAGNEAEARMQQILYVARASAEVAVEAEQRATKAGAGAESRLGELTERVELALAKIEARERATAAAPSRPSARRRPCGASGGVRTESSAGCGSSSRRRRPAPRPAHGAAEAAGPGLAPQVSLRCLARLLAPDPGARPTRPHGQEKWP